MSRSKRVLVSIASGYGAIAVNILYTVTSVPLALHYLSRDEFGMWALISQLSGYLLLLDVGMSGAVSRFLADYKDNIDEGTYGSILKTGAIVFLSQSIVILLIGVASAFFLPNLLNIPENFKKIFTELMVLQTIVAAATLLARVVSAPLWSHQRHDIENISSSFSLIINFVVLWISFQLGWKLFGMIAATTASFLTSFLFTFTKCLQLRLYPQRGHWGSLNYLLLKKMLHYGGGIFLISIGTQLLSASQIIIVSRTMGLEAASVWAISTKVYTLGLQFIGKIFDSSAGALAEMVARNELHRLANRLKDLTTITATLAALGASYLAALNAPLIKLWTSNRIEWQDANNILLGFLLFIATTTRCHTSIVGSTKDIRGMKYIYLTEGLLFASCAFFTTTHFGFSGLLLTAIACNIVITGSYGAYRTSVLLKEKFTTILRWIERPFALLMLCPILFFASSAINERFSSTIVNTLFSFAIISALLLPLAWFFSTPQKLRTEILTLTRRALH